MNIQIIESNNPDLRPGSRGIGIKLPGQSFNTMTNIITFLLAHDLSYELIFSKDLFKWMFDVKDLNIYDGVGILGGNGFGETPNDAVQDWINDHKGKCVILNWHIESKKKIFNVPKDLTL